MHRSQSQSQSNAKQSSKGSTTAVKKQLPSRGAAAATTTAAASPRLKAALERASPPLCDKDSPSSDDTVGPDIVEPPSTFAPHHQYTLGIARRVLELRVRDKRNIYVAMRQQPPVNPNAFLPHYGLSAGEFAVWQILNERPRRSTP